MPVPKKIVIIGPESTGKSTICQDLAAHYHTSWVPEFARAFLLTLQRPYTYDDLLTIARGQLEQEDRMVASATSPVIFIDTDMYVMKVWCEFVFGKCHSFILDQIVTRHYDAYLLCNTDLPWVADELREYPDLESRERLYHMYHDLLIHQSVPWFTVRGDFQQRLDSAVTAVDGWLSTFPR